MAAKANSRAKLFADLGYKPAKDYDPEQEPDDSVQGSDEDESEDERAGTEHYVAVSKSKLRRKEPVSLGPQYRGTRVSRNALEGESDDESADEGDSEDAEEDDDENNEFDDPDAADLEADEKRMQGDPEIESDEAFGESDKERYKDFALRGSSQPNVKRRTRPTAADFMSDSEDEASQKEEEGDDSEEEDDDKGRYADASDASDASNSDGGARLNGVYDERSSDSMSDVEDDSDRGIDGSDDEEYDDEEEGDEESGSKPRMSTFGQNSLARQEEEDESDNCAATNPAMGNIEKGRAVRQQRDIFDGLLNIRIRLQKALIATNSFQTVDADDEDVETKAAEAAEEAAVGLWNMIEGLRSKGRKRKREINISTPTDEIWNHMQDGEEAARIKRRKTLDMWSSRVGTPSFDPKQRRNLNKEARISSVLDDQLFRDPDGLVRRTQVPRSCAPAQASKKVKQDPSVYDDADFYQALLKELVDLRSVDSNTAQAAAVAREKWAAMKDANPNKVVDRKASRGRKMRFTVHEKLVGFMAPEDRRSWEEGAITQLFGKLLGQKMELDEEEQESEEEVIVDDGLRLYG